MSTDGHPTTEGEGLPTAGPVDNKLSPRRRNRRDGLFSRNSWWWMDFMGADGKRHRKKAAPDYQTAKLVYRDTVAKIARGEVLGVREEGISLRDFAERRYWPTVRSTLSLWEQRRARAILDTQILPRFGGARLAKLRREDVERWQAERLQGQGDCRVVSGSTANKELMRLKHLLNRAVAWGYLKDNPSRLVKKAKEAPGRVRYLTPDEQQKLITGAPATLRPYVVAALQTGPRRGELLTLRWANVDMRAGTVTFPNTKNGDSRTVPMTNTLRALLTSLSRPFDRNALVLPEWEPAALTVAFGRLVRSLGLVDLRFHDLRHDAASTLTMAGVPQRTIMALLGHRDPRMTLRYQHLSPGHLRDAVRALDRSASLEATIERASG
jgi:integrase